MGKGNKTTQIRNVLPRRMYKERGQLSHREHLGILEKRKDYKRRSDNFKQKDRIISKFLIVINFMSNCRVFDCFL